MPNGALAISLRDGDKTPSQLAFAAVLLPPLCFPAIFRVIGSSSSLFFLGIGLFPGMVVLSLRRMAVLMLRRMAVLTLRRQPNF